MVMHSACPLQSISFVPCVLFVMDFSIADKVFHTRLIGLRVPAKVIGCSHKGSIIEMVSASSIIHAPWTPSRSGSPISSLHPPPPSPSMKVAIGGTLSAVQLFGRLAVLETHALRY